jgi:hypothetical protein
LVINADTPSVTYTLGNLEKFRVNLRVLFGQQINLLLGAIEEIKANIRVPLIINADTPTVTDTLGTLEEFRDNLRVLLITKLTFT